MKSWIALAVSLTLPLTAAAGQKYLSFYAAGGEPEGSGTIFDDGVTRFGNALKSLKNGWATQAFVNGGHEKTQAAAQKAFTRNQNAGALTAENLQKSIDSYEQRINEGLIQSGDQILLVIDSHGRLPNEGERYHSISTGTWPNTKPWKMEGLEKLAALAEKKGIQLGIVDLSCHSGHSLPLANPKICVISASGPSQYALNGFSDQFYSFMKEGRSLEEVFLAARASDPTSASPQISTPAGKRAEEKLYAYFEPFLKFNTAKPIHDTLEQQLFSSAQCEIPPDFSAPLKDQLRFLMEGLQSQEITLPKLNGGVAIALAPHRPDLKNLYELLDEYQKLQTKLTIELRNWGVGSLKTKESFRFANGEMREYTHAELLESNFERMIRLTEKNIAENPAIRVGLQANLAGYRSAQKRKEEIIRDHPKFADLSDEYQKLLDQFKSTQSLAHQIAVEERKVYDSVYESEANAIAKDAPNPCRDFKI